MRLLTLIDEYTRECLAIRVERRMGTQEVIETLSEEMLWKGIPEHLRSDNGPEFIAQQLRQWLAKLGTATLYIEPGSPWEGTVSPDQEAGHRSCTPWISLQLRRLGS